MITLVLLGIGVALILVLLGFFGISEIITLLSTARIEVIIAAVLLQVVILLLLTWRMYIIANREDKISFKNIFRVINAGLVFNFLTPVAKVGGEPVKILLLRRRMSASKGSAIVAIDSFVEILSGLIAVVAIFLTFFRDIPSSLLSSFLGFMAVVIIALFIIAKIIASPDIIKRIIRWGVQKLGKHRKIKKKDYAALFYKALKTLLQDRTMLAKALGISLSMKFVEFGRMWLAFLALGFVVPIEVIIIAWAIMLILFMIPWLPGSLGLVEFGVAAVFVLFSIPQTIAAGGVLLDRFISFWFVLLLGIIVTGSLAKDALGSGKVAK